MTTTARLCTSILRSFKARVRGGTRTARAGAVTSATKVVLDRDLMQSGTEVGSDMHLTSIGMCGAKSALARVVHSVVAHLTAAELTFAHSQRTFDCTINV